MAKTRRRGGTRRKSASREARLLIITGLSGSGKTHVARALEDIGWFCVDNLPSALIPRFAELIRASEELRRSALVVDMREREFLRQFPHVFRQLRRRGGLGVSLLFLEADEKVLVRRFSETRRPHPLAINQPAIEGIREEREALKPIRKMADLILDTSDYTVHQLRDYIREHYDVRHEAAPIVVSVMSFGYKYGVPSDADLVFDVRFLPPCAGRPLHAPPEGHRGLPREGEELPLLRDSALHQGGQELPDDRDRMHGRAAPLGDDRQLAGGRPFRPGVPGACPPPGPAAVRSPIR